MDIFNNGSRVHDVCCSLAEANVANPGALAEHVDAVGCCTWLIPLIGLIFIFIVCISIRLDFKSNIRNKYNTDNQNDIGPEKSPLYPEFYGPALPFTLAFLYHLFILVFFLTNQILFYFGFIDEVNIFGRKFEVRKPNVINSFRECKTRTKHCDRSDVNNND